MPDHIDATATGMPLFQGMILMCARQLALSVEAHEICSWSGFGGTVRMQSAITDGLLQIMAATSATAMLFSAVISGPWRTHRTHGVDERTRTRFASTAAGACECTRGACSTCPARWSL